MVFVCERPQLTRSHEGKFERLPAAGSSLTHVREWEVDEPVYGICVIYSSTLCLYVGGGGGEWQM